MQNHKIKMKKRLEQKPSARINTSSLCKSVRSSSPALALPIKRRLVLYVFCLLLIFGMLSGCNQKKQEAPVSSELPVTAPVSSEISSEEETIPEEEIIRNPFTGEPDYTKEQLCKRPAAIMINNLKASLPQAGIAAADIIYELPVEADITRLMAVYSDYENIPTVGSVRSSRHDFVELALPLNAFYIHFGWSDAAKEAIQNYRVDNINGLSLSKVAFSFDNLRHQSKATEHCWFTDGSLIKKGIEAQGYSTLTEPLSPVFSFASMDEVSKALTLSAKEVRAPLSNKLSAEFFYDEASKSYRKSEYGSEQIDLNTNLPVSVTNIFLMYSNVSMLDQVHKDIDLSKGTGYYITEGRAAEVTFKKESVQEPIRVFDQSGEEIQVNAGKSWFCIAPSSEKEKVFLK